MHLQTIALAEDRVAQLAGERRRRHSFGRPDRQPRRLGRDARRLLARGLVAVSRASAAAVRRLDACLAEDLARRPVAPDGA